MVQHGDIDHTGITGVGGSSATGSETFLTGDVTLTSTNTFYDGPSQSCVAGNWLFVGSVEVQVTGAGGGFLQAKLWDGTTVFHTPASYMLTDTGAISIAVCAYAVLSGTQTVKISVARSAGTGGKIAATSIGGNGTTNKTSKIVCIKLA